jgi:hypothetical protein
MLPPLAADETEATRRNVFLHTSNGSMDVDLFVVGGDTEGDPKQKRVNLSLKSSNGSTVARLVSSPSFSFLLCFPFLPMLPVNPR